METKKNVSAFGCDLDDLEVQQAAHQLKGVLNDAMIKYDKAKAHYINLCVIMVLCVLATIFSMIKFGFGHWGFIVAHVALFAGAIVAFEYCHTAFQKYRFASYFRTVCSITYMMAVMPVNNEIVQEVLEDPEMKEMANRYKNQLATRPE